MGSFCFVSYFLPLNNNNSVSFFMTLWHSKLYTYHKLLNQYPVAHFSNFQVFFFFFNYEWHEDVHPCSLIFENLTNYSLMITLWSGLKMYMYQTFWHHLQIASQRDNLHGMLKECELSQSRGGQYGNIHQNDRGSWYDLASGGFIP